MLLYVSLYFPLINGFWLADDFSNLYRAWLLDQQDQLFAGTMAYFSQAVDAVGAFYRPLMIASLNLSYALFSDNYFLWATASVAVHAVNSILVALVTKRLLSWSGYKSSAVIAMLAGVFFAFSPVATEAVAWVSTRSDRWVTLLSLVGLWFWSARPGLDAPKTIWLLPVCVLIALGFKESAVIIPLQILLLALVWPGGAGRSRWLSLALTFLFAAAFLFLRYQLLGSATEVYRGSGFDLADITSLFNWWRALFSNQIGLSLVYLVSLSLLILTGLLSFTSKTYRLGLAVLLASGGLVLATMLNLGSISSNGEGGRLFYAPLAWLFIALGVITNAALYQKKKGTESFQFRSSIGAFFTLLLCITIVLSSVMLSKAQIDKYVQAQDSNSGLRDAIPVWAEQHEGLTMLLVPERIGPVVAMRNGQGAIVMPPIQRIAYLQHVLPTRLNEIERRHSQFEEGLTWQLRYNTPTDLSESQLSALFEPAPADLPDRVACWHQETGTIQSVIEPMGEDWFEKARWQTLTKMVMAVCPSLE